MIDDCDKWTVIDGQMKEKQHLEVNTAFNVARGYAGKYNNPLNNSGLNYANTYANNQLGQQIDKAGSGFRGGF